MPRPKAADPANVDFHVRTTRGEADALDAVISRWGDDMRAQGFPVSPDKTAWFRWLVRREAASRGVPVVDPPSPGATPEKPAPKARKRAGK